ncbi:DUF2637 domain-containing protein [Streptomyces sp. CB01881]|uniref:DUF2637 domain-containing protein n=1 Tax=Streptomyces sp. CB01881 TaxID=2078691 RepID=UPI000CDC38F2|nr:DUF2637 domain-containing protein [Streptomyces sp. CB01881]AUY51924.1 hypothetical protein C2142_26775 [Streptomyces sp. CB01881]TYC71353.1 DUF2637 domain-containing protein [Streptomyces sp. CB01881]
MSRRAKFWMVAALLAVVGMAFRVSWNALKDVASAIGADPTASTVYPLVVDGLMALALIAVLVLIGDDRRFALRVLVGYTAASLVLNYVHGLVPTLHTGGRMRLADWAPAHWALVLLASSLPVGSIYFGSDLVAKVLHHRPEPVENHQTTVNRSGSDLPEPGPAEPEWPLYESADPAPAPAPTTPPAEPTEAPAGAAPAGPSRKPTGAASARPRRSTGTVPAAARTTRPTRTAEELLTEARSATADWPDTELTADRIREAVRTSSAKARVLRDTLHAERTDQAAPETERPTLHAVPAPTPATGDTTAETVDSSEEKAS